MNFFFFFLSLSLQVYTWFHFVSCDPRAEVDHLWRLRVCVCPECVSAVPPVGYMCRDPSPTKLGAGALHHSFPYYEVNVISESRQSLCFILSQGVLQDLWNISESSSSIYLLLLHWFGARETCYSKSRQHGSHRNTLSCHNHGEFFFFVFFFVFQHHVFVGDCRSLPGGPKHLGAI